MGTKTVLQEKYLNLLYEYCNTYDSEAISSVLLASGAKKIEMSKIYTELKVIPKSDYEDRVGRFSYENSVSNVDIDKLIAQIDKKIFEINVETAKESEDLNVKEKRFCVCVSSIVNAEKREIPSRINEELKVFECVVKSSEIDEKEEKKRIFVLVDSLYSNKIKIGEWCYIRGYFVSYKEFEYLIMDPHWIKLPGDNLDEQTDDKTDYEAELEESERVNNLLCYEDYFIIPGEIILSEPGGGKTTYLKKQILNYIECIRGKSDCVFPIWISTREIRKNDIDAQDLSVVIVSAIDTILKKGRVLGDDVYHTEEARILFGELMNQKAYKLCLIVDSFEELSKEDSKKLLVHIEKLYSNNEELFSHIIISSRYKEYGYQRLEQFAQAHQIQEKFICELKYDKEKIIEFVKRWYDEFRSINTEINPTEETEKFRRIYDDNPGIKNLINTPIELTSLIMLSITQMSLPTDLAVLYRNIIEIWLTFNAHIEALEHFSLEDILMELSRVALYMACSENEKIRIKHENLVKVIDDTKSNFRRYYRNSGYVTEDTQSIIDFIVRRNIMEKNEDVYQFKHRQYQTFLCSNCIIRNYISKDDNNIISEKRQLDRMQYFKKHLDDCDDFWDQIIIFSAYMDIDLHDSILNELTERAHENPENNYYVGILLQLVNSQGFWFEKSELELVYDELFRNATRWELFSKAEKQTEIKRMLIGGREENNTAFIRKGIEKYSSLLKEDKDLAEEFKDMFANLFFFTVWRCKVDYSIVEEVFKVFLTNYITTGIISEVYKSFNEGYNETIAKNIKDLGNKLLDEIDEEKNDASLIVSLILGYEERKNPYEVALSHFEINNSKEHVVACSILFIAAWLIQLERTERYGYGLTTETKRDIMPKCREYVIEGILKEENKLILYDYMVAFRDWCLANYYISDTEDNEEAWYDMRVFQHCLRKSMEKKNVIRENRNALEVEFEVIASFPLSKLYAFEICKGCWSSDQIAQIVNLFEKGDSSQQAIYAFKLLILAGEIEPHDGIKKIAMLRKRLGKQIGRDNMMKYYTGVEKQTRKIGGEYVMEMVDKLIEKF